MYPDNTKPKSINNRGICETTGEYVRKPSLETKFVPKVLKFVKRLHIGDVLTFHFFWTLWVQTV